MVTVEAAGVAVPQRSQPSPVMVNVFEEARNSGVTVAVSAGNYGSPGQPSANPYTCTNEPEPRCSAPNIVQVGATDWNDARWAAAICCSACCLLPYQRLCFSAARVPIALTGAKM